MKSLTKISLCIIMALSVWGCKKHDKTGYETEINAISGVYHGWEHLQGTALPVPDSNAVSITVKKIDYTTFEIIYEGRSDAYPRKFSYSGHTYNFIDGGSFPYHHTINFFPSAQKMELEIHYDDGQGHSGEVHFIGNK